MNYASPRTHRPAFSTVELLVSLSIASVLTLGLTGSIVISSKSLQLPAQPMATQTLADGSLGRLRDTIADAKKITREGNTIEVVLPDDSGETVVTYQAENGELFETSGSAHKRLILGEVDSIEVDQQTSLLEETGKVQVDFEGAVVASGSEEDRMRVRYPAGCVGGDLLLLLVGYDKGGFLRPSVDAGWTQINTQAWLAKSDKSIVAWSKPFESNKENSVTVSSIPSENSIACLLRVSKADIQNPVLSSNGLAGLFGGIGRGPAAPPLAVSQPGCLVVQALLTDKHVLSNGNGGLMGHVVCGYEEESDMAMVCSVRQVGNLTGIVDSDNLYKFSGRAEYVMSAISLKTN